MAGYSGKSLAAKLGMNEGKTVVPLNAPKDYRALLGSNVRLLSQPPREGADIVHLFVDTLALLDRMLPKARKAMKPDGMLWVSWYKKGGQDPDRRFRRRNSFALLPPIWLM